MVPEYLKQGEGPPLVYVSGLDGSGKLFYKQAEDLARDHTVISFPLRGEGRYDMRRLVEDLAWVVRDAGAEGATVLGEFFGGLLTMATSLVVPSGAVPGVVVSVRAEMAQCSGSCHQRQGRPAVR